MHYFPVYLVDIKNVCVHRARTIDVYGRSEKLWGHNIAALHRHFLKSYKHLFPRRVVRVF